jgi:hypothetical protein
MCVTWQSQLTAIITGLYAGKLHVHSEKYILFVQNYGFFGLCPSSDILFVLCHIQMGLVTWCAVRWSKSVCCLVLCQANWLFLIILHFSCIESYFMHPKRYLHSISASPRLLFLPAIRFHHLLIEMYAWLWWHVLDLHAVCSNGNIPCELDWHLLFHTYIGQ